MAEKRYYWLKLHKDFFKRHEIRIIEDMPNGKDYILFYLKLLVESVTHEGSLRFSDTIPYNEQMLATITNTNVDVVKTAMKIFVELNMIEILDDQTVFMTDVAEMIGSETDWAVKKRLQRAKKDNVPELSRQCPTENRDKRIDIRDKSIDIEGESVYGKFENVALSPEEYKDVCDKGYANLIDEMSEAIESGRFKTESCYASLLSWGRRKDADKSNGKLKRKPSFDIDEIAKKAKLNEDYEI